MLFFYLTLEIEFEHNVKFFEVVIRNNDDIAKLKREIKDAFTKKYDQINMADGRYPVILKNLVSAKFLEFISTNLYADYVVEGFSRYNIDDFGKKILSEKLTIIDDPNGLNRMGYRIAEFDDEGTECKRTTLINDGKLLNFICDQRSSAKLNISPTGNGFNFGYNTSIQTQNTNLFIIFYI